MLLPFFQRQAVAMMLHWLLLLAQRVEAVDLEPLNYCPAAFPGFDALQEGLPCDFWDPEMQCRYEASVCSSIANPTREDIFFKTLCKCDVNTGTILCEDHPSNVICEGEERTNCPFDPFSSAADVWDPNVCTGGCDYDPFGCPGDDTLADFTVQCVCEPQDSSFICAVSDIICPIPEPPEETVPTINFCDFPALEGGEPCDFWDPNQECRYGASVCGGIANPTREDIFFQTLCKCDSVTGTIVCEEHPSNQACAAVIRQNCPFRPFTDEASQWDPDLCTGGGCDYDPFGCPGDDSEPSFITNCDCVAPTGLVCAQASIFCQRPDPPAACAPNTIPIAGIGCVCFSGESLVETKNSGILSMSDLTIGDMVKVDKNDNFEPVYSFGHYSPEASGKFLVFNEALELSPSHMIAVQGRGFVPASSVVIGDYVIGASSEESTVSVKTISTKISQGVFAPFTPSGTIVVNGIVASCFVSMQPANDGDLQIGSIHTGISWHTLAHAFELPRRLICHYLGQEQYCREETYTADGISTWLVRPFNLALWMTKPENGFFAALLWVPILMTVCISGTIDKVLTTMPMFSIFSVALAGTILAVVYRRMAFSVKSKTL